MAEHSQQQRNLSTVVNTMISSMLHQFAQCHGPRLAARVLEFDFAMQLIVL